jgi:hypothetical protein
VIEKSTLNFIWKQKNPQIAKAILSKRAMLEVSQYLTSNCITKQYSLLEKLYYWNKNRYEDQWNRIEDQEMNLHSHSHLIFDSHQKHTMEKRQPLQQMLLGKVVICLQKTKTRSMFITLY